MVPTPSIGRIVLVPMDPRDNNGADRAPAVITRVWSDTTINVKVLSDATGSVEWRTSVGLVDELPDFALATEEQPGSSMHVWAWPPRV
jgi:hypothetical protein